MCQPREGPLSHPRGAMQARRSAIFMPRSVNLRSLLLRDPCRHLYPRWEVVQCSSCRNKVILMQGGQKTMRVLHSASVVFYDAWGRPDGLRGRHGRVMRRVALKTVEADVGWRSPSRETPRRFQSFPRDCDGTLFKGKPWCRRSKAGGWKQLARLLQRVRVTHPAKLTRPAST